MAERLPELPTGAFSKFDEGDDIDFYAPARLVMHIDAIAVDALTHHYRAALSAGDVLLDLMSSWVSHLPPEKSFGDVIGQGMNAEELAANARLTGRFVQDLNREPRLPLRDASIDAALCCVGVQYLQRPVEVFAEVARVLKPRGAFLVSFSNRCFPTKAVAVWRSLDMAGQARLVQLYMDRAGFPEAMVKVLSDGAAGDPLVLVTGRLR